MGLITHTPGTGSKQPQRNPYKDGTFWGICFGHAFTHWYPASMYLLLPYIVIAYDFTLTQAGLLITLRSIFAALLTMPIGAVTDMSGKKHLFLVISLLMVGLPFLFIGYIDQYWLFALLFITMGVGNEFWHPASYSVLAARYPEQRGMTFGYHAMASNLGDLLAPVVIGALIVHYAWQDIIVWNFVPGVAFAILILITLRNLSVAPAANQADRSDAGEEKVGSFKAYIQGFVQLLKNKKVLLIALLSGIRAMAQSGLMVLLPMYLAMQIGLNPLWVGVTMGLLQGGGLIAAPIAGGMSDKVGPRKILTSLMTVTSVVLVIVSLVRHEWLLAGTISVLGFFLFAMRPVLQSWAMDSTDRKMTGTTTSLLFFIQALMGASSPIIATSLAQNFNYEAAFYFLAAVILVGNFVIYFVPGGRKTELARTGNAE